LPRVGLRSSPKTQPWGAAWHTAAFLLGLLRSPTRGKPARHRGWWGSSLRGSAKSETPTEDAVLTRMLFDGG